MNKLLNLRLIDWLIIICFLVAVGRVSVADDELPLLGESASLNLFVEDEIGRGVYQRLKENGYIIDNPLLSRYLSDVGHSILTSLDIRYRDYHFYLVKDNSVNAFATPGGYIGINSGLIAETRSEDELASVLAHEIAHVELMHSMQMLEKAKEVNVAGMVSLLAAILVSTQNSELASALIYTGAAGSAQAMVNFTRANEYEADRMGIGLLQRSDYDPEAMVSFMELLQRRAHSGELSNIEYIRTHPINSNRIAEIQSRLVTTEQKPFKTRRYDQFRDYLFYLFPDNRSDHSKSPFYLALELTQKGQYAEAEKIYRKLISSDPDSIFYSYVLAENMEYQGRFEDAARIYQSLLLLYPDDLAIGIRLAKVFMMMKSYDRARELMARLEKKHEKQAMIYLLQVDLYQILGNDLSRQLAEANYHWFAGNRERAVQLFKVILAQGKLDAGIEARIREKFELTGK